MSFRKQSKTGSRTGKKILAGILLLWGPAWVSCVAQAQEAAPTPSGSSLAVTAGGVLDFYYSHDFTNYNLNHPGAGNAFHPFDSTDNAIALGLAEFDLKAGQGDTSARLDLGFGPAVNRVSTGPDQNILQAYVGYEKNNWSFKLGKVTQLMGLEAMESPENWNYSRSFLYSYAFPFYILGLWGQYSFDSGLRAVAYVCDGWNSTVVPTFYDKSWGGRVTLVPSGDWTLTLNGIYGTLAPPLSRRAFEASAVWKPGGAWSLALDGTWGQDDDPVPGGPGSVWSGLALYARYVLDPSWGLAARLEDFVDHDGALTGMPGDWRDGTLTLEHRLSQPLRARLEYRYDWALDPSDASQSVGAFNGSPNQSTLSLSAVYSLP